MTRIFNLKIASLAIFEKKLVNRKGFTVHSAVQIEKFAFQKFVAGNLQNH